MTSTK